MRRPERMAETLREEISEIVGYELEDPRLAAVTVTDVRVSEDLRDANIYVVVEGDEEEKKAAMSALRGATSFVRRQVALNLNLHHAPHLHFARDTVEENAAKIESILEEISEDTDNTDNTKEL
ncbi:MAG: 30S ribosome-binding factor RbfA [Acidobacteria bacterium]|nr:MAG: 30S ribosome-binding factor RbfA [Acidobacteriota bacterium]REK01854.1 MAG: 30S ribosome-binding factor RbfA [Acidobacteriota bacterium]REK14810.1 MAG: 30S ribosome-binding factor RbfA [Acidobacteriota bacterium]REK45525.1 MAG: 30S ribosome-binding factor RbfA [Acidobacteriota bacterium]